MWDSYDESMTLRLLDEANYDAKWKQGAARAGRLHDEGWMDLGPFTRNGDALPKLDEPGRLHYCCYDAAKFDALREDGASGVFRGAIVISHGFTEFARKYSEMAWDFLLAGYSVCNPRASRAWPSAMTRTIPAWCGSTIGAGMCPISQPSPTLWAANTRLRRATPQPVLPFDGRRHRRGRDGTLSEPVRQGRVVRTDHRPVVGMPTWIARIAYRRVVRLGIRQSARIRSHRFFPQLDPRRA